MCQIERKQADSVVRSNQINRRQFLLAQVFSVAYNYLIFYTKSMSGVLEQLSIVISDQPFIQKLLRADLISVLQDRDALTMSG